MEEQKKPSYEDMTLRDYLRVIFRHKAVVIVSVLTVSVIVALGLKMQTPAYSASVKMLVSAEKQTQAPYSRDFVGYDRSEANVTQSEIVKSAPVLERAVRAIHLDKRPLDDEKKYASSLRKKMIDAEVKNFNEQTSKLTAEQKDYVFFHRAVDSLQKALTVEPVRGTNLLVISVRDFDPLVAATLANVISRSYVIFDLEQQLAESATKYGDLHPTVTLLKGHIEQMKKTLSGGPLENIEAIGPATVKIISQASIPTRPEGRSKKLILLIAGFLSVVMGIGLAFIFDYLDPTVRSPGDLAATLGLPILASIPLQKKRQSKLLNAQAGPAASYLGAYHELACQVRFFVNQKNMKVFLFTAPDAAEGNTTVISNLGLILARDFKKKVLIIDTNSGQADAHKIFEAPESPGLAEILTGGAGFAKSAREVSPGLSLLSAGDAKLKTKNMLDSQKMAQIVKESRDLYEIVLIDCADLRHYRDAISLGPVCDGIVLVVAEGKTRRPAISTAAAPLKENNFSVIGSVLNGRTFALPKFVYDRV